MADHAKKVLILKELAAANIDWQVIKDTVRQTFADRQASVPIIELKDDFIESLNLDIKQLAECFARSKVLSDQSQKENEPLYGEIQYELRRLKRRKEKRLGVVYDGFLLQTKLTPLLKADYLENLFVIITNQLLATFDKSDQRYHLRFAVFGNPALISITGLVEAPARPKEYYHFKRSYGILPGGLDYFQNIVHQELLSELKEKMLIPDDERLTPVLANTVVQAIYYFLFGEVFCENKDCCLFDAHWQEDLIRSKNKVLPQFCPHHEKLLLRQEIF